MKSGLRVAAHFRKSAVCGSLLAGMIFCGCSKGDRAAVSGAVTLDGKPVKKGLISFVPTGDTKGPSAGSPITDGRYEIAVEKGVVIGSNKVTISSIQPTGRKIPSVDAVYDELLEAVPAKYNNETTLTRDVQHGSNEFDFDLQGRVPIETMRRRYPGQR